MSLWNAPSVLKKLKSDFENGVFNHHSSSLNCYLKTFPEINDYCGYWLGQCPQYESNAKVLCCLLFPEQALKRCRVCGNYIPYTLNKNKHWDAKFCSRACALSELGKKIQKEFFDKSTNGINPMKRDDVKAKFKNNFLEKYGVENPMLLKSVQEKAKQSSLERYGVENIFKSKEFIEKNTKRRREEEYERVIKFCSDTDITPLFNKEEYLSGDVEKRKYKCNACGRTFLNDYGLTYRLMCPDCTRLKGKSNAERELTEWLKSIGQNVKNNVRDVLDGNLEVDCFLESKKLCLEYDGLYWHNDVLTKPNYHLEKTNMAESKGLRMIHIFEDEWLFKKQIVKNRLKNILGLSSCSIGARKCEVREISHQLCERFLMKYHIQGNCPSHIRLGLFYKNRIVAVMTFGKPRFNKNYDWELLRYCTLGSVNVIGGAGKLLSFFIKSRGGNIITYADRRWSQGGLYEKLGFEFLTNTSPNYFYVRNTERLSRYSTQKHKLEKLLKIFDENKSEFENMKLNGFNKIYDCGNKVFSLKTPKIG